MTNTVNIMPIGETREEQIQSLLELETIIVMAGYDEGQHQEKWNDHAVSDFVIPVMMKCWAGYNFINYVSFSCQYGEKIFYTDQIEEILDFILS